MFMEVSTPPKSCDYPPGHLVSRRHICAMPHFATCCASIVRYSCQKARQSLANTIATGAARYEKHIVAGPLRQLLLANSRFSASNLSNASGQTPLYLASLQGHSQVVRALLESNYFEDSAVNAVSSVEGATALHRWDSITQNGRLKSQTFWPFWSSDSGLLLL